MTYVVFEMTDSIDEMMAQVKKIFLKAPSQILKLCEMFPNLPLPPKPVLT